MMNNKQARKLKIVCSGMLKRHGECFFVFTKNCVKNKYCNEK